VSKAPAVGMAEPAKSWPNKLWSSKSWPKERWLRARRDLADNLRFLSRLPIAARPPGALPFSLSRIAWATPLAGVVIAIPGCAALAAADWLRLPSLIGAILATAALVATTGALHEDGLADVADGFGGGRTRERKLEIMRDSRLGSYGVIALILALTFRIAALAAMLPEGLAAASAAIALIAAVSRAGALAPLALLTPARSDGLGATAGRLAAPAFASAWLSGAIVAAIAGLASLGLARALAALAAAALASAAMSALARRQIGGQTGDVAGAAQQWAEIAAWTALLFGVAGA
jgi:adenosylcobinamide-GDP ribazoletransferase